MLDKNTTKISMGDVIGCMRELDANDVVFVESKRIFQDMTPINNYYELNKSNIVVKYLKNKKQNKYFIDASILKDALAISISENNHEMKKTLTNYFKKYMSNEREGISNEELVSIIVSNNELISFIKKYENFEEYEEKIIEKSYSKMEKRISLSKENQIRGKAIL